MIKHPDVYRLRRHRRSSYAMWRLFELLVIGLGLAFILMITRWLLK